MKENNTHISTDLSGRKMVLPLYDFFIALKQNNFLVTPQQITDANNIIAQYSGNVKDESELCNFLSPLFANSQEEQIQFRQIFDKFFKEEIAAPPPKLSPTEIPGEKPSHLKKHWLKYVAAVIVMGGVIYYFSNNTNTPKVRRHNITLVTDVSDLRGDGLTPGSPGTNLSREVLTHFLIDDKPADSLKHLELTPTFDWGDGTGLDRNTSHAYRKEGIFHISAYVTAVDKKSRQSIDTTYADVQICLKNINTNIGTNFSGDSIKLGEPAIFRSKAKTAGWDPHISWTIEGEKENITTTSWGPELNHTFSRAGRITVYQNIDYDSVHSACGFKIPSNFIVYDPKPQPSLTITAAANAKSIGPTYKVKPFWFYFFSILTGLLLFFTGFFALRANRSEKNDAGAGQHLKEDYDNMIRSFSAKGGSVTLPFQNKNYLPLPEPELAEVARMMRKRINDDATFLDVNKTISKAILNAGFIEPVASSLTQQSEYLVLIDENNTNNQQVKLFDYLLDLLAKQNVFIDRYYYHIEPKLCYNVNQPDGISLEKLSEKYPEHVLLIFGNAYQLIYQLYPVIDNSYLQLINRWQYKAVVTPVSYLDWGNKERKTLMDELPVLPVDIPGLLLLMQRLFVQEFNILAELKQFGTRFYEADNVDFEDIDELLEYCDNAEWARVAGGDKYSNILFQWIAALAVYPKIRWELTLAIGKAIVDKYGFTHEMNFTNLLRIARIKWMQKGQFPDFTRLNLLKNLKAENEIIARETILVLLNEIPATDLNNNHFAFEEKETQRLINEFNLYAYDPVKYAAYKRSRDLFAHLRSNNQVTDTTAKTYFENVTGKWDTLIKGPRQANAPVKAPETVPLGGYFGDEKKQESRTTSRLFFITGLSGILFALSFLGLLALVVLNFVNSSKFQRFTYAKPYEAKVKFTYVDTSGATQGSEVLLKVGTIQKILTSEKDSLKNLPQSLLLPINDSANTVSVSLNGTIILDTAMTINKDEYIISSQKDPPPSDRILVRFVLGAKCIDQYDYYKSVISKGVHDSFPVDFAIDPDDRGETDTNKCINTISYGKKIGGSRLYPIFNALNSNALPLFINQNLAVADNEVVIYYLEQGQINTKPTVYINISDDSLISSVRGFKRDMEANGYKVTLGVGVSTNNSLISYYDSRMKEQATVIKQYYDKYFPGLNIPLLLQSPIPGRGADYVDIWIRKYESSEGAKYQIRNSSFTNNILVTRGQTSSTNMKVSFDIVNINSGKPITGKQKGKICVASEGYCSDFIFDPANDNGHINQQFAVPVSQQFASPDLFPGRFQKQISVKIPGLGINQLLGTYTVVVSVGSTESACDTIHAYVGNGSGNIAFNKKYYTAAALNAKGIGIRIAENDAKHATIFLSKKNCSSQMQTFYTGQRQSFKFCDGTTINLLLLDWRDNSPALSYPKEIIFDAIICRARDVINGPNPN